MSETSKPPAQVRFIFVLLIVIGCAIVIAGQMLPSLTGGGPSIGTKIVHNLKQIDLAKQMWAQDHNVTNSTHVSAEALIPYLPSRRKPGKLLAPVIGERYIINSVGVPPEAQLTTKLGKWPAGTIIRLHPSTNGPYEVILPNTYQAQAVNK